jgi:hypothetical protein
MIGCTGLPAELGILRTRARSATAAGSDTPPRGTTTLGLRLSLRLLVPPPPQVPGRRSGRAGVTLDECGLRRPTCAGCLPGGQWARPPGARRTAGPGADHRPGSAGRRQTGAECRTAGNAAYRRAGAGRQPGFAGRYQAGTVCSIARSTIARRQGVNRRPGSIGSHRAGTVCSTAGSATTCRAGGEPPARICWAWPGGHSHCHSVPVRWEPGDSESLAWGHQCQWPAPSAGPLEVGRAPPCAVAPWFTGRVSREGRQGRRSTRACLPIGPAAHGGPGVSRPFAGAGY